MSGNHKAYHIIYPVSETLSQHNARFIQILHTADALARNGCQVDLIIGRTTKGDSQVILAGYGIVRHPFLYIHQIPILRPDEPSLIRFSWNGIFNFFCFLKIKKLLNRNKYNAIYLRHLKLANFLLKFKRIFKVPFIFEAHEIFHLTTKNKGKVNRLKRLEKFVYPNIDGLVTITNSLKEMIKVYFDVKCPIYVIPDGVDLEKFSPKSNKPNGRKIIYIGQLYLWKGIDTLIRAMEYVKDAELHIVGGKLKGIKTLKVMAERLKCNDRITFHGHIPIEQVTEYLKHANVAIIPLTTDPISTYFTSPLKLFEYMASKVPIVASDLPSIREILIDKVNAVLVKPEDPKALADGIKRVLDDRKLAQRISDQAYLDVQKYTWEERAKGIIEVIHRLSIPAT